MPNEPLAKIHDRMPVIVRHDDVETWIGEDADAAAGLMVSAPDTYLRAWAVGRAVGDVRNDGPELLAPINLPAGPDE
nr:SOS response-associated peptidase family protein [Neoroseomonas lacus]